MSEANVEQLTRASAAHAQREYLYSEIVRYTALGADLIKLMPQPTSPGYEPEQYRLAAHARGLRPLQCDEITTRLDQLADMLRDLDSGAWFSRTFYRS